jgi:hypothetical protein
MLFTLASRWHSRLLCRLAGYQLHTRGEHSWSLLGTASRDFSKGATVVLLWVLVALLLLFAIVGGVAISKFLFFVLIVVALLALIGFFARRTA